MLADISVFITPNNTEYNIKDATARGWKGAANGVAELDSNQRIPASQLPTTAIVSSDIATTTETQQIITDYDS